MLASVRVAVSDDVRVQEIGCELTIDLLLIQNLLWELAERNRQKYEESWITLSEEFEDTQSVGLALFPRCRIAAA
jgi:hypothetical protein